MQISGKWCVGLFALIGASASPAFAWDSEYIDPGFRIYQGEGFAENGSAFLLARGAQDITHMRRITPAGAIAWDRELAEFNVAASRVDTNDTRACVAFLVGENEQSTTLTLSLVCVDDETGGQQFRADNIAQNLSNQTPVVRLNDDNTVVLFYTAADTLHRVSIAANGSLGADTTLAGPNYIFGDTVFADDGSVLTAKFTSTESTYYVISPTGAVGTAISPASTNTRYFSPTLAPDGGVFIVGTQAVGGAFRTVAARFSANGTQAWRVTVRDDEHIPFPAVIDNDTVYFAISHDAVQGNDFAEVEAPHAYIALNYATGAERWDVDVPENRQAYYYTSLSADGTAIVGVSDNVNKFRVQTRSTDTGAIIFDSEYDCGAFSCSHFNSQVAADGKLRVIAQENANGKYHVYALSGVTTTRGSYIVGQTGIRGAWNIGTDGQGIVFDYEPTTRTLFAPWFTKSHVPPGQGTDTTIADLHWYTLQTTVPPDAPSGADRSVPVTIYETSGGSFATGASISPHRVGQGAISFSSCDEGTLLYDFDEGQNGGVSGILGLGRLTPRTDECIDVGPTDIVIAPAQTQAQDAAGFRSAFSGTWSQIGSGGQGMELVVQPGASISGAWFTFDPANQSNDAKNHHWFTLLGALTGTTNATVTATLYQNLGGSFDFRPAASNTPAGTATIHFESCTTAQVSYAFNATAGSFANTSGTIAFEHLGGCIGAP
jgi:hypothetical protein